MEERGEARRGRVAVEVQKVAVRAGPFPGQACHARRGTAHLIHLVRVRVRGRVRVRVRRRVRVRVRGRRRGRGRVRGRGRGRGRT